VERAKKESPFGGPIAHGYMTLSLLVPLASGTYTITDSVMGVNYGLNKVRFPAPVPVGSKVRAKVVLKESEQIAGGVQNVLAVTVEREGGDKPVCIAEWVVRAYAAR
jgi:acyl dehydratase